jgi:mRNA interferase RelE/StbE
MKYRVELTSPAARDLDRLPRGLRERVVARLVALEDVPRPDGIRQLKPSLYRLRVGDYRVVYSVEDKAILVLVLGVLPRKDVYRWLRRKGVL